MYNEMKTHTPSSKRLPKVGVVDVSVGSALSQNMEERQASVVWVPNSQQKCPKPQQKQEFRGDEPLKIGIKDFVLENVARGSTSSKDQNPAGQKCRKDKKRHTGGCPPNFPLSGNPQPVKGHLLNRISVSCVKEKEQRSENKWVICGQNPNIRYPPHAASNSPIPEHRRLVLHGTNQSTSSDNAGPVYKMDDTYQGALGEKEVDLESIRNQYYLWKKYVCLANPSGRISTSALDHQPNKGQRMSTDRGVRALKVIGDIGLFPWEPSSALSHHEQHAPEGSARSNTALSRDGSNISFIQSSWSDLESQAEEAVSPEPPCDEVVAEAPQALDQDLAAAQDTAGHPLTDPPKSTSQRKPQILQVIMWTLNPQRSDLHLHSPTHHLHPQHTLHILVTNNEKNAIANTKPL
ncbi:uncharacterized protein C9orf43 homolog isoform X2 [Pelobates fuscus]